MATEFQMPKLGLTMESGTILQWIVPDGAEVKDGDIVMIIETDKVETEIGCSGSGLLKQTGVIGETYDCGVRIGWFLEPGEEAPADEPAAASAAVPAAASSGAAVPAAAAVGAPAGQPAARTAGGRLLVSPNARRVAASLGVDLAYVAGTGPGGRIVSEDVEEAARNPRPVAPAAAVAAVGITAAGLAAGGVGGASLATFAARSLAETLGIGLHEVPSLTGDARLTKEDVAAHARRVIAEARGGVPAVVPAPSAPAVAAPAASAPLAPALQEPSVVVPLRAMRGTIAKRMHESLQQSAQLTLFMDVDMTAVVADRTARREAGDAPGYTDYVIAATAAALRDHPHVNSQITDDGVAYLPEVHIGMAVALDDGLMVPVIRDTASLDLAALGAETTRLAEATRGGSLGLDDLSGGTFSVTALGMFGVDGFTPIINPPNTAILGVGRLRDELVWDGDTPTRVAMLTLSLTWDHRAFDGAPAAAFTGAIKAALESGDLR